MTFDAGAYRKDVLKPLVKDRVQMGEINTATRELQTRTGVTALAGLDLPTLFAMPVDRTRLADHFKSVDMALNKSSSMSSAKALAKLLAEMKAAGAAIEDPAFWDQLGKARLEANKAKITEFAEAVALENQALKIVVADDLHERAASHGLGSVPAATLAAAVEAAGVTICADFDVPQLPIPRVVADIGKHSEFRSIVDVLLLAEKDDPPSVRVVDGLRFGSGAGTPITAAQIDAAQRAAISGKDSDALQAAQKMLTLVRSDFADPIKLHQLVLAVFVAAAKEMLDRGDLLATALGKLVNGRGLDSVDAARLLAKLSGTTSTRGLTDVTNLLSDGALADARRTFDAIANPDQFDAAEIDRVKTALVAAETRKATLLSTYESAMKSHDYGAAAQALGEAVGIDKQDSRLQTLLDQLPPTAPESLVVRPDAAGGVTLSWRYSGGKDTSFVVVRSTDGHAPANPADGTQLTRDLDRTSYSDSKAPVAQRLHYSVFAVRRGAASLPASADQILLPAPTQVTASSSLTEITLMWRLANDAVGVQVAQINPDGSKVPVNVRTGSRVNIANLVTGSRYRYLLEAIYVLPDGTRLLSPTVSVDATPRGLASPVTDLRVSDARLPDGREGHRAVWTEPAGFPVELWSFPVDETIPALGAEVSLLDLDSIDGRRLNGVLDSRSTTTGLSFPTLRDLRVILALTVDGDRGVAGDSVVVGTAPSVKNPRVDRYGDELVASWEWPHGDYAASVTWSQNGHSQSRKYTRAEYKINGGFRIPNAADVDRIAIATVAFGNGNEWIASPVEIALAARLPVIRYELDIPAARFGRRKPARVVLHSADYTGSLSLLVVARTSSIMPSRPDDGDVIKRIDVTVANGAPMVAEFDLPKLPSPFWIRLFSENGAGVKLEDPPTTQLKG